MYAVMRKFEILCIDPASLLTNFNTKYIQYKIICSWYCYCCRKQLESQPFPSPDRVLHRHLEHYIKIRLSADGNRSQRFLPFVKIQVVVCLNVQGVVYAEWDSFREVTH